MLLKCELITQCRVTSLDWPLTLLDVVTGIRLEWPSWMQVWYRCSLTLTSDQNGSIVDLLDLSHFTQSLWVPTYIMGRSGHTRAVTQLNPDTCIYTTSSVTCQLNVSTVRLAAHQTSWPSCLLVQVIASWDQIKCALTEVRATWWMAERLLHCSLWRRSWCS